MAADFLGTPGHTLGKEGAVHGELVPVDSGTSIKLTKERMLVGRRDNCDIVLRHSNVSSHHCELYLEDDYWHVRDLNSRNGTRVNGVRVVSEERLDPGDVLSVAHHEFGIQYTLPTE